MSVDSRGVTGREANVAGLPLMWELVGLCPGDHMGEFYVPLTEKEFKARRIKCPRCDDDLIVYRRVAE